MVCIYSNTFELFDHCLSVELSRLKPVLADYKNVKSKSKCLPGTQEKMQESILGHLRKSESRFVLLRGSPGTGKTAISLSIASDLDSKQRLAASFFWDKNQKGTGLDAIEKFPSTLARQLAVFSNDFKMSLVKHLRKPELELAQNLRLELQLKALVIEPMRDLFSSSKDRNVIILDGLDECEMALRSVMELVGMLHKLPPCFSVLVSCRPEPAVKDWVKAQGPTILCEDVDTVDEEEKVQIVRRIIENELEHSLQ